MTVSLPKTYNYLQLLYTVGSSSLSLIIKGDNFGSGLFGSDSLVCYS